MLFKVYSKVKMMSEIWQQFDSDQWMVLFIAALLIGMAKAGIKGLGMFIVPMMAAAFGGKASVGSSSHASMADVFAVSYYNRHASGTISNGVAHGRSGRPYCNRGRLLRK